MGPEFPLKRFENTNGHRSETGKYENGLALPEPVKPIERAYSKQAFQRVIKDLIDPRRSRASGERMPRRLLRSVQPHLSSESEPDGFHQNHTTDAAHPYQ